MTRIIRSAGDDMNEPPDTNAIQNEVSQRTIPLSTGPIQLPAYGHEIRTKTGAEALQQNQAAGMPTEMLLPLASRAHTTGSVIPDLLGGGEDVPYAVDKPFVIPDIEAEAFSVSCQARLEYQNEDNHERLPDRAEPGESVRRLLNTSARLRGSSGKASYLTEWRRVEEEFSLLPVAQWAAHRCKLVHGDTLTLPAPMLRANSSAAQEAINLAQDIIRRGRYIQRHVDRGRSFEHVAVEIPIHYNLTDPASNSTASSARAQIHDALAAWSRDSLMDNVILLLKLYDTDDNALGPEASEARIHTCGELIRTISEAAQRFNGIVGMLETGRFTVGAFDNGVDIAASRIRGPRRIDMPVRTSKTGPRDPPDLRLPGSLEIQSPDAIQAEYEQTGSFDTPSWVSAEPYWDRDQFGYFEQLAYASRVQSAAFQETAGKYRQARKSERYAVRLENMVDKMDRNDAVASMCPSLA